MPLDGGGLLGLTSCFHPGAALVDLRTGTRPAASIRGDYFFMFGARRFTFFTMLRPWTVCISANSALVRRDRLRRKWLLPPLVLISLPPPVRRKRLEVALWV